MNASTAPADNPDTIDLSVLVTALATQIQTLHHMTEELEGSLSATLTTAPGMSPDGCQALQRVDYIRQSLGDLGAIMDHLGSALDPAAGQTIAVAALRDLVVMRQSFDALVHQDDVAQPVHEIWL